MLRLLLLEQLLLLMDSKPRPRRWDSIRPVAGTLAPLLLVLAPLQLPGLVTGHRKALLSRRERRKHRLRCHHHLLAIQRVVLIRLHFDASGGAGRSAGNADRRRCFASGFLFGDWLLLLLLLLLLERCGRCGRCGWCGRRRLWGRSL